MGDRSAFLSQNPWAYYELEEDGGPYTDTTGLRADGTISFGTQSSTLGTHANGVYLNTFSRAVFDNGIYNAIATSKDFSFVFSVKPSVPDLAFLSLYNDTSDVVSFESYADFGRCTIDLSKTNQNNTHNFSSGVVAGSDWRIMGVSYDSVSGRLAYFCNGVLDGTRTINNGGNPNDFYAAAGTVEWYINGQESSFDNIAAYTSTLPDAIMINLTGDPTLTLGDEYTPSLPLIVSSGDLFIPSIPITVTAPENFTPSLPLSVNDSDPSSVLGTAADWRLDVYVDGVLQTLVGSADTDFEEDESPTARVRVIPPAGALDPEQWENKSIEIDFVGVENGVDTLLVRRFTGVTELATFDPDEGVLSLTASGDLQTVLDRLDRSTLDFLIGGVFSPYVASDEDYGYEYALSLLETVPKEIHIDANGSLVIADWAANVSPDITFTDDSRFDDTLNLTRARRGDLINKATVNVDFRFPRLRHRELNVNWGSTTAWCDYLTYGFQLCNRQTVESAFQAAGWTVIGDISYTDIPPGGAYTCGGVPRIWIGGQDMSSYCLGASAKVARRWVQTVTETAELSIVAQDSIDRVGELPVESGYGLQATYDEEAFEAQTNFDSEPVGSSLNTAGDHVLDADAVDYDGRTAFETAQTAAASIEAVKMLDRHRRNTVSFSPLYRPDIDLTQTVRVDTPGLVCQGKIRGYRERFNFDTGRLDLDIDVALSRHGGSGSVVADPILPADKPAAPVEAFIPRTIYSGYHIGGLTLSLPESDDMEGYICNATVIEDVNKLYSKRFRIILPEVESTARSAVVVTATKTIEVEIPQDELTLNYWV